MTDSTTTMNPTGGAEDRRRATQPALHNHLMEAVLSPANLQQAWRRVKSNRGAPGIDGMRIEDFPAHAREHWSVIRQSLNDGSYRPQPVRRVTIPKPDGGERALGIGWMGYFGISEYYRPIPELDEWLRRRVRMCYWKQWRLCRTKISHLLALGVGKRTAILTGISSKSYWHLSRSKAT